MEVGPRGGEKRIPGLRRDGKRRNLEKERPPRLLGREAESRMGAWSVGLQGMLSQGWDPDKTGEMSRYQNEEGR